MAKMKRERKYRHSHHPISGGPPPSGCIFICNRVTKPECFQLKVFGLPMSRIDTVMRIEPGSPLFLFDCELRILYGVYRAASHGGANLVPHIFGGKFQAQVKFQVDRNCDPLPESVFKHAIQDNYSRGKFRPDLDYQQVSRLLQLFKDARVSPQLPPPFDSRYAHQTVRHPTSTDPQCVPSSAPPPPYNIHYYSAPPNASYSSAPLPPPLQLLPPPPPQREQYYAPPTNYPAAPLPLSSSNDQYYAPPTNYPTAPLPPPSSNDQYYAPPTNYPAAPLPPPSSNDQYYAAHPYNPAQALPRPSNDQYYAAPPYYLDQALQAPPNYQHNSAPPKYPGQLPLLPTTLSASQQYYLAPPNDPYYTQNHYPRSAVPA